MRASDGDFAQIRLRGAQRLAVEHGIGDAERARLLGVGEAARLAAQGPERLYPAAGAQQIARARRLRQRLMLGHRAGDQRAQSLAAAFAWARGGGPVVT